MKKIINKLDKKKIFYLTLALVFIMMLVLNYFTPLLSDDFVYSFDYSGKRIKNVGEIFDFQIIHYLKWGEVFSSFYSSSILTF